MTNYRDEARARVRDYEDMQRNVARIRTSLTPPRRKHERSDLQFVPFLAACVIGLCIWGLAVWVVGRWLMGMW